MTSKLIKVDALVRPLNRTESIYINLVFKKSNEIKTAISHFKASSFVSPVPSVSRQFLLNSNNLLDVLERGDEFFVEINIEENSPTWLGDNGDNGEGQLINVRQYLESKLNRRKSLAQQSLLDKLKFYNDASDDDDGYFYIEDNVNGVLLTRASIQFDYEVERSYFTRVMIVQEDESFVYWLDVRINVVNIVDEPFVCSQPVYHVNVDENEVKNKELLTLSIVDYDMSLSSSSSSSSFEAQIVSGNAQGLFDVSGLTLYTSNSARKLDRETRAQHELEIRVIEKRNNLQEATATTVASSRTSVNGGGGQEATTMGRFATCKIVVNVNDVNDNR